MCNLRQQRASCNPLCTLLLSSNVMVVCAVVMAACAVVMAMCAVVCGRLQKLLFHVKTGTTDGNKYQRKVLRVSVCPCLCVHTVTDTRAVL